MNTTKIKDYITSTNFSSTKAFVILFIIASLVYSIDVWRPIDASSRSIWREVDMGSIARNYYLEDMNLFMPRIDWRGDGPGFVESEFPIHPWLGALLYNLFGYHEEFLRVISLTISLGTLITFYLLARYLLTGITPFLAAIIFTFHPLFVLIATSIQPEALMCFGYLLAIYTFLKWIDTGNNFYYIVATFSTTLAILAKAPAAHVGILFLFLSFHRFKWKAFHNLHLWLFAIITLTIPFLWYHHAHSLWVEYGNSLGLSNEGFARIFNTNLNEIIFTRVLGVLKIELLNIWYVIGAFFGILGFISLKNKEHGPFIFYWFLSLIIFYLVTGGTTGQDWAHYYHIVSVPFSSIVMAQGLYSAIHFIDQKIQHQFYQGITYITIFSLFFSIIFLEIGHLTYRFFIKNDFYTDEYATALKFKKLAAEPGLIITNGTSSKDSLGRVQAGNNPYYFFWMEQKGFNLHANNQNMETLMNYKNRGAKYFIIDRLAINTAPNFYAEVFKNFEIIGETPKAILIKLI